MKKQTTGNYNNVSIRQLSHSVRAAIAVQELQTNYDSQSNKDIRQVVTFYGVSSRTIGQLLRIAREYPDRFNEVMDGFNSVGGLHQELYL